MHFSVVKKCLLALVTASTVLAQTAGFDIFTAPSQGSTVSSGTTFDIQWTPSAPAGKISIILLAGATQQTLQLGPIVASSIDSSLGTYAWVVVPRAADLYGLKLQLDSNTSLFQYSYPFIISGGSVGSSATGGGATPSGVLTTKSTVGVTTTTPTTITAAASSSSMNSSSTLASAQGSSSSTGSGSQTSSSTSSSSNAKATGGASSYAPARAAGILGAIAAAVAML